MENKKNKGLNIGLWLAQILIALTLIWGAYAKLFMPIEALTQMLPWAKENASLILITGTVDLLGGLGLIVPGLFKMNLKITVYTALAIVLLMISASIFHISRGEVSAIGFNIFILILALFVAWGRNKTVSTTITAS